MAAELKRDFGVDAVLFAEGKGIFDVIADGRLIYSKYTTNRFPEVGEVARQLRVTND